MAIDRKTALKTAQRLLDESDGPRSMHEAWCALQFVYAYGNQWATTQIGSRSNVSLNQLRLIVNPNRTDVRLAMNITGARSRKVDSRLSPRRLDYKVEAASRAINDLVAADVGTARLRLHTDAINTLRKIRRTSFWRVILGSCILRRTMSATSEIAVRDAEGKPSIGPNNKPRTIRTFDHDLAVCPPYEFIRDAAANNIDFDGEDCIGHEKPRTLDWIKRNFPEAKIPEDTGATMGNLLEFQRFLYKSMGHSMNYGWRESKTKAVLVSEWWYRDDSPGGENKWPIWMLCWRDSHSSIEGDRKLNIIDFGPSPYHNLPLHHYWYANELLSPWGIGVPHIAQSGQDAMNIAWMSMLRHMVSCSLPKWSIEANSLVDKTQDALTNRADVAIVYRKQSAAPQRIQPAAMDSTTATIIASTPEWLDRMLNMSPVQAGYASKRGEAARALEVKKEAADTPLTYISDEDEMTTNNMLTGTLFDILKTDRPKAIVEQLSGQFTYDQILTLTTQDAEQTLSGVKVVPDSIRPRTPREMQDDAYAAVNAEMVAADAARRTLLVKGGVALDAMEEAAYNQQTREIQMLLGGEDVGVELGQDHDTHMWRIRYEQESPNFQNYTDAQKDALQNHWTMHLDAKARLAEIEMQVQQPPGAAQAPLAEEPAAPEPLPMPEGMPMGMPPAMPGAGGEALLGGMPPPGAGPGLMPALSAPAA